MGRHRRFIPPRSLVEVTCRTVQGRYLLRPSRELNEIVIGILARAARLYRVQVVAFVALSNHAHYLLVPDDAEALAQFMCYVNGNLAREAGRLHGWREKFWGRRYQAVIVSDEEEVQVARLRYLLSQGCKEGLVRSPRDWPGASSMESLLSGRPLTGTWFDRTAASKVSPRHRGKVDHAQHETLELSPLPAWAGLPANRIRILMADLVDGIERETQAQHAAAKRGVVGRRRILRQDPHLAPEDFQSTAVPFCHARHRAVRVRLRAAFLAFNTAYERAVERLRANDPHAYDLFPDGSFPPGLPFRGHRELRAAFA